MLIKRRNQVRQLRRVLFNLSTNDPTNKQVTSQHPVPSPVISNHQISKSKLRFEHFQKVTDPALQRSVDSLLDQTACGKAGRGS